MYTSIRVLFTYRNHILFYFIVLFLYLNCIHCTIVLYVDFKLAQSFNFSFNRIGGVMVSVLHSSVVDRGFEPWSNHTKDYTIGICCFSVKPAASRRQSKDWLAQKQDNVYKWGSMSFCRLLFQC